MDIYSKMSIEEIEKLYNEIYEQLTAPLPPGSLEFKVDDSSGKSKRNNATVFIPEKVYITRLQEAAGVHWGWSIKDTKTVKFENIEYVQVIGQLRIVTTVREGIGYQRIQRKNGNITDLKYTILAAEADALRNACDLFSMGWKDLAPYRDWAKNPGVKLIEYTNDPTAKGKKDSSAVCVKCNRVLTKEDLEILSRYNLKINYCKDHIPPHFLR